MQVTVKTILGNVRFTMNAKRVMCRNENNPNIKVTPLPDSDRFVAKVNVGFGDTQLFTAATPAKAYAKAVKHAWS